MDTGIVFLDEQFFPDYYNINVIPLNYLWDLRIKNEVEL